jgi:hypothetical protein
MTANELADKLQNEKANTLLYVATVVDSANMLRQQAKEIESLKKEAALQRLSDFTQEAEIEKLKQTIDANNLSQNIGQFVKPAKTLTDEQIESAWFKVFKPESGIGKNITNGVYEFARAILKKASEK